MKLVSTVIRSALMFVNKTITDPSRAWDIERLNSSEYVVLTEEEKENVTLELVYFRIPIFDCEHCRLDAYNNEGKKVHTHLHRVLPYLLQPDWIQCLRIVCMVAHGHEPDWLYISRKRRRRAQARVEKIKTYRHKEISLLGHTKIRTWLDTNKDQLNCLAYHIYCVLHVFGYYSIAGFYSQGRRGRIMQ